MSSPSQSQTRPEETIMRKKSSNTGMYAVLAILVVVIVAMAAYFLVIAPPKSSPSNSSTAACVPFSGSTLQVAGSTFVAPLMDQWEVSYTDNSLNYQSVGSGTGISDITTLAVDAGASDAPLSYSQAVAANKVGTVLQMPESAGGAAIIYNLQTTWHAPLNFTANVLAKIFQGTITMWNDQAIVALNPSDNLPSESIVVVHRSDGSGTSYMTQQFLQWDSGGAWNLNYSTTWLGPSGIGGEISAKGSSGVTAAVKDTPGAISYVDLEYALANGIGYGAVQNVKGTYVVPTISDIQSALLDKTSEAGFALPAPTADIGPNNWSAVQLMNAPGTNDYPIASFTYLIFFEAADKAFPSSATVMSQAIDESLADFLNWTVSPNGGQSYAAANYYVPLPPFVVAADQSTVALLTWGGNPVPNCASGGNSHYTR
jgi:phosphate transport system substrate-binding protein